MTFRVPFWYRFHGAFDPASPPPHKIEGSRVTVIREDRDLWYDDWKKVSHNFPEITEWLSEKGYQYTPACEWVWCPSEDPKDHHPGMWNTATCLDFVVPGEGIFFAMWTKGELSKLSDRILFARQRQHLPEPKEPFEGVILK